MFKKVMSGMVSLAMALSVLAAGCLSAMASETTFPCVPEAADNGANGWWVGVNANVTPTTGSGFTLASKDGTAVNSNIVWTFTVEQLKKTPSFNIKIGNSGAADSGPYLKMFYGIGGLAPAFKNPDFIDENLEDWVRANAKSGLHSFDMTSQLGELADDTLIYFALYVDPAGTNEALQIDALYLSGTDSGDDGDGDTEIPGEGGDTENPGGDGGAEAPGEGGDTENPGGDGDTEAPGEGGSTDTPGGDKDTEKPADKNEIFAAKPLAADDGANGWWVGVNATVTPTTGSGFTLASKDGTAVNSNIVWTFTVEQLKKTPYFNIKIGNSGKAESGPYLRMFYGKNGLVPAFKNPDFVNESLEDWVRANSKTGLHTFDMTSQLSGLSDSDVIYFALYVDPSGTSETLKVEELYLSEKDPATTGGGNKVTDTGVDTPVCCLFVLLLSAAAVIVVSARKRVR